MSNVNKTMTRKRSYEDNDYDQRRFNFIYSNSEINENENLVDLFEKLSLFKKQLNDVKGRLSDKDIADWNRHTAYMNRTSTIVPYLREKLNIEIGTQAWAKMFEILSNFHLVNHQSNQKWITLHLCEAPGAFISALNHFLVTRKETANIDWQWFAQTLNPYYEHDSSTASMLIDDDRLIFHTINENHWDFGIDNTGNIMSELNIKHYIERFQPMGISLITADGSFDVQNNPGEQELLVYPLLKTEVHVALSCLMTHGNFLLKIFTMFERETIELIYLLYRTFQQISMFKPKTSKSGNSEVYIICLDFNREKYFDSSLNSFPLSSNFLNQLIQCSQYFQSSQIETIENNLHYFHNIHRRFIKKLHRIKDQTLDTFLDQCQVRELLLEDRHLLKSIDYSYQRIYQTNQRITRNGTFNDQHQIEKNFIEKKIEQGYFCLICSNNQDEDLCSICQILPQIITNRSIFISRIYIGQLIAKQRTIIDYVIGKQPINIQNSCFCNRYLLELCHQIDIYQIDPLMNFDWIKKSSSIDISPKDFQKLQQFTSHYQINFQTKNGIYYVQSSPILTRLQASVIYILTRLFQQTFVYVIPSLSSTFLLFIFEIFQTNHIDEYHDITNTSNVTLLQFVHIHQLLDQHFAFNLIQANNLCLQVKYLLDN